MLNYSPVSNYIIFHTIGDGFIDPGERYIIIQMRINLIQDIRLYYFSSPVDPYRECADTSSGTSLCF
jgi:hypothetical protein